MKKYLFIAVSIISFSGCYPSYYIKQTVDEYDAAESQVQLGDSKQRVLEILEPTQKHLTNSEWRKRPDRYTEEGVLVEIYYFRSGLQSDGLTTDDEFTPYIFNNDKLVGIGWAMIGGPKTYGQTTPTTNVNVKQTTTIY